MWLLKLICLYFACAYMWPCIHAIENDHTLSMTHAGLCAAGFAGFVTLQFFF